MPERVIKRRLGVLDVNLYGDGHLGLVRLANKQLGLVLGDVSYASKRKILAGVAMLPEKPVSNEAHQGSVDEKSECREGQTPGVRCSCQESAQGIQRPLFD